MTAEQVELCGALRLGGSGVETLNACRRALLARSPDLPPRLQLPLHLTVLWLGHHAAPVRQTLRRVLSEQPLLDLPVCLDGAALLTRGATTAIVARVSDRETWMAMQDTLEAELRERGVKAQDRFTGTRYRPHVTLADGYADPAAAKASLAAIASELASLRAPEGALHIAGWMMFAEHGDMARPVDVEDNAATADSMEVAP